MPRKRGALTVTRQSRLFTNEFDCGLLSRELNGWTITGDLVDLLQGFTPVLRIGGHGASGRQIAGMAAVADRVFGVLVGEEIHRVVAEGLIYELRFHLDLPFGIGGYGRVLLPLGPVLSVQIDPGC